MLSRFFWLLELVDSSSPTAVDGRACYIFSVLAKADPIPLDGSDASLACSWPSRRSARSELSPIYVKRGVPCLPLLSILFPPPLTYWSFSASYKSSSLTVSSLESEFPGSDISSPGAFYTRLVSLGVSLFTSSLAYFYGAVTIVSTEALTFFFFKFSMQIYLSKAYIDCILFSFSYSGFL